MTNPKPELVIKTENHVEYREDICPDGWTEVDVYHPSTTPWDYYASLMIEIESVKIALDFNHQSFRTIMGKRQRKLLQVKLRKLQQQLSKLKMKFDLN